MNPRKTPLFVPPPPPKGYRVEYNCTSVGSPDNWRPLYRFHDLRTCRHIAVSGFYLRKSNAEKIVKRIASYSDWPAKPLRIVPVWPDLKTIDD